MIVDATGAIAGQVSITAIVRGPFLSAALAYWVSHDRAGQGLATTAVAEAAQVAFGDLGLHRLQAATLVHNHASMRVLTKNGFRRIGLAPAYLSIAGRWQDHILFQLLSSDVWLGAPQPRKRPVDN